ncbi:MAG: NAD(P)H-dependent oxidoreductase [Saprospiraceae bacterium]|nr:NAD(P)H-dependent oxidoreductase [Saprospiraceae bacterium]
MAKRILVIYGHPSKTSLNYSLAEAYCNGAQNSGHEVKKLVLADMEFEINLQFGFEKRMELEQDLKMAQEYILWAEHLVFVHPVWWGGLPALFKGFIDRCFLPGFAFKYRENSVWWDKLLSGKTAHIITTLDQPGWYYWLMYGRPSVNQLKKSTLEFCGINPVKLTYVGAVRGAESKKIKEWIDKAGSLGEDAA